ncbi:MAG: hypothetical protein M9894_38710 [Planctomycetes bacterium]|nr:hypothetical protein [Planctomycetota bacterium]
MDVELIARDRPARCAVCHDDAAPPEDRCEACGALLHAECRRAVGGCPTLGCRERAAPAEEGGKASGPRRSVLLVGAAVNAVGAVALVALARHLLDGTPPGAPLDRLGLALVGAFALGALAVPLAARATSRGVAVALATTLVALAAGLVTPPAWARLRSIDEDEAFALGRALDQGLRAARFTPELRRRFDLRAAMARHGPSRPEHEREYLAAASPTIVERLASELKEDGSVRLVGARPRVVPRLVVRVLTAEGELRYLELPLARTADGEVVIIDVVDLRAGGSYARPMARSSPPAEVAALNRMREHVDAGRADLALAAFQELPAGSKEEPELLLARLKAAEQADDAEHEAALADLVRRLGDATPVLALELAWARGDHPGTLAAIDALDARVGGDPYLDAVRAGVHQAAGDPIRGLALALRAVEALPDMRHTWWALLEYAVEAREHGATRRALERLQAFGYDRADLEEAVDLEAFLASPEGQAWRTGPG